MKNIYKFKNLSQSKNCQHLVTKKDRRKAYSFSLALHTQEKASQIINNRAQLKLLYPNKNFVVANQIHSSNIQIIKENKEIGWSNIESAIENCDALVSNQVNIMLTILTADCVPILLFDPVNNVVAAVHAGWKGTQHKIVRKTVKKMQEVFNTNTKNILAGIAPSIGECCYEVDWNVAQHFDMIPNAYTKNKDKYMLNLPLINKVQLLSIGLQNKNIEMSNVCTACEVEHYFSYRKEGGCSGRFMSMIGLK